MLSARPESDTAAIPPERPAPGIFKKTVDNLSRGCGVIAAFMIVIAVLITCQMIYVRFVLNQSTVWQTEVVIYLMIGATLLGLPYVQLLRGHVNVDLLPIWLGNTGRRVLALVTLISTAVILSVMFFYSFEMWYVAWDRGWTSDTVWAAPLWIPYLAMPVGFGLFLLQVISDLFAVISRVETPFGMPEKR
ncbi:MAG: TRAP transporter small permease [Burkholderiaceae bacterium]